MIRFRGLIYGAAAADEGMPYLSVVEPLRQDPVWMAEVSEGDGVRPGAGGYENLVV